MNSNTENTFEEHVTLAALTEHIRGRLKDDLGLSATLKLWIEGEELPLYIDATQVPVRLSNRDVPADCVLRIKQQALREMLAGQLKPLNAFMTGKLKVEGDMAVALNLQKLI